MIVLHNAKFQIGIHDDNRHGWFEHNDYGDEYGGGLWFHKGALVDYDGIAGYLPKEVLDTIEAQGFDVSEMRPH